MVGTLKNGQSIRTAFNSVYNISCNFSFVIKFFFLAMPTAVHCWSDMWSHVVRGHIFLYIL